MVRILAQPRQPRAYQTIPRDYVSGCKLNAATNLDIIPNDGPCVRPLCRQSGFHTQPARNLPAPWLDVETYRLKEMQDHVGLLRSVTPADLQRAANRLFKSATLASIVAGDAMQLKPALHGKLEFEVLGEIATPAPSPKPPAKPASNINPR